MSFSISYVAKGPTRAKELARDVLKHTFVPIEVVSFVISAIDGIGADGATLISVEASGHLANGSGGSNVHVDVKPIHITS